MAKHGEGLGKEIVNAVNNGEIKEPLTTAKVEELCKLKGFNYSDGIKKVILSNSEMDTTHSDTYKKYFKRIVKSEYVVLPKYRNISFEEDIQNSMKYTKEKRLERLSNIKDTHPEIYLTTTSKFKRNPDVIAHVLLEAKGICEKCGKPAPFNRASDQTPYLEVHHKQSLSEGGEDTVGNCIAVCPNCHRMLHYG